MVYVRDIFYLKFGKAREAKALIKEAVSLLTLSRAKDVRVLTDLTGKSYRLILVTAYENVAEWEKALHNNLSNNEWRLMYEKFIPLVDSAEREILSEVK